MTDPTLRAASAIRDVEGDKVKAQIMEKALQMIFSRDQLVLVDNWIAANDLTLDRSEAIRRLVELGLTVRSNAKRPSPASAARAKELAGNAIDNMSDATAPPEEQAQRRRRLTKGPLEFREARVDHPSKRK